MHGREGAGCTVAAPARALVRSGPCAPRSRTCAPGAPGAPRARAPRGPASVQDKPSPLKFREEGIEPGTFFLRARNSPMCTLSQIGHVTYMLHRAVPYNPHPRDRKSFLICIAPYHFFAVLASPPGRAKKPYLRSPRASLTRPFWDPPDSQPFSANPTFRPLRVTCDPPPRS